MKRSNAAVQEKWRSLLADFSVSGLTVREFCRKQGLAFHQFKYWKQKFQNEAVATVPRFAQVVTKGDSRVVRAIVSDCLMLEVVEVRIGIRPGFDKVLLQDLLQVLGGTP
jgi:transposase-like protein